MILLATNDTESFYRGFAVKAFPFSDLVFVE